MPKDRIIVGGYDAVDDNVRRLVIHEMFEGNKLLAFAEFLGRFSKLQLNRCGASAFTSF